VIIPVRDHGRYLAEAIDSVLVQTHRPDEIIVVDDGSRDDTAAVAARFVPAVTYVRQEAQGLGAARDRGIRVSSGDYLAHLDADDVWTQDKLERQLDAFARDPELDLVGAEMEEFFSPDAGPEVRATVRCRPWPQASYSASVIVVTRAAFLRVGFYETEWRVGTDLSWFLRARDAGLRTAVVPRVLARRRLHAGNTSLRNREFSRERVQILKLALDRRRARETGGGEP
jgi:glycosyltransferase involved in cell wall biosynthesis